MMLGGAGIGLGLRGKATNAVTLFPGDSYIIPSGNYQINLGPYTSLQWLDPVTGIWRNQANAAPGQSTFIAADGANQRLANLTGCPVAAVITTASATGGATGVGATATSITVTPSSGSSTWCPVVGGALSLTCLTGVTGSTPGSGYLYPPQAIISAPPPGGLQATAHITGIPTTGALLAAQVIIDNQGAGYPLLSTGVANASLTIVNDPRDTTGTGCAVRLALTGTGALTGLYPLNQGLPLTGVPTLSFSAGAAGATVVMNFTVTSFATGWTGVAWSTGAQLMLLSNANLLTTTPVWTNPIHEKGSTFPRPARIAIVAGTTLTTTGATVEDGGFGIQQVPTLAVIGQVISLTGALTGVVPSTAVVGGVTDTSWLQPV